MSLALQAAAVLGDKIKKLALYEAPYSEAEGAARDWKEFRAKLDGLLAAERRVDAITQFMKFVGAPDKLAQVIPGAQRHVVEGQAHDISAKALAPLLLKFFN